MAVQPAELIKSDQDHLIHPLHHPSDHLEPMVYVKGRGAHDHGYPGAGVYRWPRGLGTRTWGTGREELAKAAATQMGELAYFSATPGRPTSPPSSSPRSSSRSPTRTCRACSSLRRGGVQ